MHLLCVRPTFGCRADGLACSRSRHRPLVWHQNVSRDWKHGTPTFQFFWTTAGCWPGMARRMLHVLMSRRVFVGLATWGGHTRCLWCRDILNDIANVGFVIRVMICAEYRDWCHGQMRFIRNLGWRQWAEAQLYLTNLPRRWVPCLAILQRSELVYTMDFPTFISSVVWVGNLAFLHSHSALCHYPWSSKLGCSSENQISWQPVHRLGAAG